MNILTSTKNTDNMSTIFNDAPVKQAVVEQINTAIKKNTIPDSWLTDTLSAILGIKKEQRKRVPLTKAQLIEAIKYKINNLLGVMDSTSSLKEIKDFIKNGGDEYLTMAIQGVPTTRLIDEPSKEDIKVNITRMIGLLSLTQCWDFLASCNRFNYTEWRNTEAAKLKKKMDKVSKKKITTPKQKTNYVTCTNEEAIQILAPYYEQLADGNNSTPECFKAVTNPTQAFQRFVFSHLNQTECGIINSINETVYNAWKIAHRDEILTADELERKKKLIEAFKTTNPDYMDTLKAWSTRPYIKCLLKKDEVKPTQEATTNTGGSMDDFISEIEEEMKKEEA